MNLYFCAALFFRYVIENTEVVGNHGFSDIRKEMSSEKAVLKQIIWVVPLLLMNTFHLMQNVYWLKLVRLFLNKVQ